MPEKFLRFSQLLFNYELFAWIWRFLRKKIIPILLLIVFCLVFFSIYRLRSNNENILDVQRPISLMIDSKHSQSKHNLVLNKLVSGTKQSKESLEDNSSLEILHHSSEHNSAKQSQQEEFESDSSNEYLSIKSKCRNTVQGKLLIADDQGFVCNRKELSINGCCDNIGAKKFDCLDCKQGCCTLYEHCVSCCLEPENSQKLNQSVFVEGKFLELNTFKSSIENIFDLCLIKCRTSSASLTEDNVYKNPNAKYCFTR